MSNKADQYENYPWGIVSMFYHLMSSMGKTREEALALLSTKSYAELERMTHCDEGIIRSGQLVLNRLLPGYEIEGFEEVARGDKCSVEVGNYYLGDIGAESMQQCDVGGHLDVNAYFKTVVKSLSDMHDADVQKNLSKINRDNAHLCFPFAFMSDDEQNRQAMIIAPLFAKFHVSLGQMDEKPQGKYEPSGNLSHAYKASFKEFANENNLQTWQDARDYLKNADKHYKPLQGISKESLKVLMSDQVINEALDVIGGKEDVFLQNDVHQYQNDHYSIGEMPLFFPLIEAYWASFSKGYTEIEGITDIPSSQKKYVIPYWDFGIRDTHIVAHAFHDLENMEQVFLPKNVVMIHADSFQNCPNLRDVYCANPDVVISDHAFDSCPKVKILK